LGRSDDEDPEDGDTTKWDEAQNWTAYGRGLYEGRIAETARFTIRPKDKKGNKLSLHELEMVLPQLSVVLESQDLHYDVDVRVNERDCSVLAEFVATRLGEYELSILLDGFDIYGSPYHPKIQVSSLAVDGSCLLFTYL